MKKILTIAFTITFGFLYSQQTFQNVTSAMGISGQTGLGHAVGWGDIDNDGDPDLGISNQEGDGFWFYRNDLTGFTDITASAGLSGLSANKIIICELTGDAYNDLLIRTRQSTQKLFKSNGDGTFTDISASSGVSGSAIYNVADFNNDGLTDLLSVAGNNYSILYNNGNETFSAPVIIAPLPDFMGVAVLDYNNDGLMDIYGTTYGANPNQLLKNNGDGTFTDKTVEAGLVYNDSGHGLTVGDYNNDGFPDVYVGSYSSNKGLTCKLFKNNGDGTFTDVSASTGTQGHTDTRTTAFNDYNNDGWLDIFSSHHDFYVYSNTMLKSNAGESFTEVAHDLGISGEFVGDYFGEGWADFNLDGAIDFFAAGHIDKYRLFKNNNCPGTSLSVTLKGVLSNPNGIGAEIKVGSGSNAIYRFMLPSGGLHDFSELKWIIGLNGAYSTDSLTVYWPSGIVQKFGHTNAGQNLVIVEDTVSTGVVNNRSIMNNFQVSPNPFHNRYTIRFALRQKRAVSISLLDLQGKTIETLVSKTVEKGAFTKQFDGSNLPQGLYLIRVRNGNHYLMKKIMKQ